MFNDQAVKLFFTIEQKMSSFMNVLNSVVSVVEKWGKSTTRIYYNNFAVISQSLRVRFGETPAIPLLRIYSL